MQPFHTNAHEFYFIRHGQTDHNIGLSKNYNDGLNKLGKKQAKKVALLIQQLPIKTICSSPLLRAQQTTKIINATLQVPDFTIHELQEGPTTVWQELATISHNTNAPLPTSVSHFLHQIRKGLRFALQKPEPVLIVAHNGVFCGICQILKIKLDHCRIQNCELIHFEKNKNGRWMIKIITS